MLSLLTGPLDTRPLRRRTGALAPFRGRGWEKVKAFFANRGSRGGTGVLPIIFRKRNCPDAFQRQFGLQIFVKILVMI